MVEVGNMMIFDCYRDNMFFSEHAVDIVQSTGQQYVSLDVVQYSVWNVEKSLKVVLQVGCVYMFGRASGRRRVLCWG